MVISHIQIDGLRMLKRKVKLHNTMIKSSWLCSSYLHKVVCFTKLYKLLLIPQSTCILEYIKDLYDALQSCQS